MRIAIVHSFYRSGVPSGENAIVESQVEALSGRGHDVTLIRRDTDDEMGDSLYRVRAASRVLSGRGSSPMRELMAFEPDLVHVHNTVPGFGTSWVTQCPWPVVATLHNFRPVCANGLLFRDGRLCTDCPDGSPLSAVRHGCYQGSRLASIPLSLRNARGVTRNELLTGASAVICLSQTSRDVIVKYGLDAAKVHVIPNGISLANQATQLETVEPVWLAAGRLSPEKGMLELARSWPDGHQLHIIGSGPEEQAILGLGRADVSVRPTMTREEFRRALPAYQGLVFPSLCIDSQPTVVSEALASGLPVIAWSANSVAALVHETGCGVVYRSTEELAAAVKKVSTQRALFAEAAFSVYRERLTVDVWLDSLERLYSSTLAQT